MSTDLFIAITALLIIGSAAICAFSYIVLVLWTKQMFGMASVMQNEIFKDTFGDDAFDKTGI